MLRHLLAAYPVRSEQTPVPHRGIARITEANLSLLRTGKVKGVRFDTLAKRCEALDCTPGELLDIGEAGPRG